MPKTYQIDPSWIAKFPERRRKSRVYSSVITIFVLAAAWLLHPYVFWTAILLTATYWFFDLRPSPQIDWEEICVQPRTEGLFQTGPNLSGGDPLSLLTPWSSLKIKKVKNRGNSVTEIRLADESLPKGARSITLQGYENMEELLSEIQARTK
jgi:hypothetical protein